MTEHEICVELMRWVGYHLIQYPFLSLFHHVANEGKRNPMIAHSEGMLAGLPDYHLPVSDGHFCGFWLEIKKYGKKPTKKQIDVINQLRSYGNHVAWCDTLGSAIAHIEDYAKKVKNARRTINAN